MGCRVLPHSPSLGQTSSLSSLPCSGPKPHHPFFSLPDPVSPHLLSVHQPLKNSSLRLKRGTKLRKAIANGGWGSQSLADRMELGGGGS